MAALRELIKRFPQTDYARDARLKLDLTRDHLAGKEMAIGRYYLKRGEIVAAVSRFRTVVEQFQTTSHVPEALHRLVEAYLSLGVVKEAQASAAVLGHNYPGSEWYEDTYALMKEYGSKPNAGQRVIPIAPAPSAAPELLPTSAPPPPPPSADAGKEDGDKPKAAAEKKDDSGFFDWF